MLRQGLFEIAARTYRNRASIAASLDEDDALDAGEAIWEMATDDESLELAATNTEARQPGNSESNTERARLSERELSAVQQPLRHAAQGLADGPTDRPARSAQSASRTGQAKSSASRRKKSEPGVMRREIDSW